MLKVNKVSNPETYMSKKQIATSRNTKSSVGSTQQELPAPKTAVKKDKVLTASPKDAKHKTAIGRTKAISYYINKTKSSKGSENYDEIRGSFVKVSSPSFIVGVQNNENKPAPPIHLFKHSLSKPTTYTVSATTLTT